MPEKFKAGDIVELKSGGPKMTIKGLDSFGERNEYACQWFGDKKLEYGVFPADSLKEPLIKFGYTLSLPSGAKARVDFVPLAARLKSCPDTKPA